MKLKKVTKRELNQTLLKIELHGVNKEDYQMRMLQENHIEGLLDISSHGAEAKMIYEYDISGKTAMNHRYNKKKIDTKEMKEFLEAAESVMEKLTEHLLNPNSLLLDPEHIYWENGHYYFCYVPCWEDDILASFHKLIDSFVQWTDYQDEASVKLAFFLHKETMEDNYSLKKIIDKVAELEREAEKKVEEKEPESSEIYFASTTYETAEHDWITQQELGSKILRETDNMWTPVKRFLQKHKRPKWGDWDGIYIDEEDLDML